MTDLVLDAIYPLTRLPYEQMKEKVFIWGDRPDGYNGHRVTVGYALHETRIYVVSEHGYFASGLVALDEAEAIWTLKHDYWHRKNVNWHVS